MRQALETVVSGGSLDVATARAVMDTMMEGEATPAQVGALVAALRTRGETVDELAGMVESMRAHATQVTLASRPSTRAAPAAMAPGRSTSRPRRRWLPRERDAPWPSMAIAPRRHDVGALTFSRRSVW